MTLRRERPHKGASSALATNKERYGVWACALTSARRGGGVAQKTGVGGRRRQKAPEEKQQPQQEKRRGTEATI